MVIPKPPTISQVDRISPSLYEAALKCKARAAWSAFGDQSAVPNNPAAILGTCFHAVVEAAHDGQLETERKTVRSGARELFDKTAERLYNEAHSLIRAKFPSAERLPYYNWYRERAALQAVEAASEQIQAHMTHHSEIEAAEGKSRQQAEIKLSSSDGLLVGRADYFDEEAFEVVDYKTGVASVGDPGYVSESEARQLRLYVYLYLANGILLSKGSVVRGNGHRATIDIPRSEAEAEAEQARRILQEFNAAVSEGKSFSEMASPSPSVCCYCPCIPFCESFWANAEPSWAEGCGVHLEGRIVKHSSSDVQGTRLLMLEIEVHRGTIDSQIAALEQLPEYWTTLQDSGSLQTGDIVRLTHGRITSASSVINIDKTLTALWRVSTDGSQNDNIVRDS